MSILVWPSPRLWSFGFEHGPWYARCCWSLRLGPLQLHVWPEPPLTWEQRAERLDQRIRRAARLLVVSAFAGCLLGVLSLWPPT